MNELRNIFIKLDATNAKNFTNNQKSDILDNASFEKKNDFNINLVLDDIYKKCPKLYEMDKRFGYNDSYWIIGYQKVSKRRVFENIYNYVGDGDILLETVMYNANFDNRSEVERTIKEIPTLEMDVKKYVELSQGI